MTASRPEGAKEVELLARVEALSKIIENASVCRDAPGTPVAFGHYDDAGPKTIYVPPDELPNIPDLRAQLQTLRTALNKASCVESKQFPDHWCCVACGAWYDYATKECLGHTEGCYVDAALAPRPRHE